MGALHLSAVNVHVSCLQHVNSEAEDAPMDLSVPNVEEDIRDADA
jgi:hypothetical protein